MKKTSIQFLYVTFPNKSSAKKVSKELLQQKLIACANILSPMESLYCWKDKITVSKECVAIFKTKTTKRQKLERFLLEKHPYDVPCVATISIDAMNTSYEEWLLNSLSE